jgi:transposase
LISKEQRARIRRLYYAEHWKVGTIAAELGVHPDTVKRALELHNRGPKPRPIRPTLLDPYKPFIGEVLEQYPRLRATRLYEMLQPRGYAGSVIQLRRYVKTVRPATKREAFLRLSTMPGEQGQVDWGHFGKLQVGSVTRPLSCFVMVLSHSRAIFARFFLNQVMESFLQGHVEAFEWFGGVPRTLLYDNLKSVVIERDGELMRLNPRILELAGYYHFAPKPCAPYRGNEKGKVERTIRYIRDSFFAAREFRTLEELNGKLRKWLDEIAHVRPVPGSNAKQPIAEVLDAERERLLPLPEHAFSTELVRPVRSGKTPYIRFDSNDYSIPHTYVREPLTLVASERRIRILDAAQSCIVEHPRSYDGKQRIENPEHIRALARVKKRHAPISAKREQIMLACPHAAPFFAELCERNVPMTNNVIQLRRLLEAYGREALDAALKQAVERGAVSSASVAHILEQARRRAAQPPVLVPKLSDDPRIHQQLAVPHALAPYDQLLSYGELSVDSDTNINPVRTEEPDDESP